MPPEVETHLVNAVLTNGARYYVDHAHPELSTPECADARVGGRVRQGRRADPAAVDGGGRPARCRRARRSSSTRTTPTARATATAATRTTSWTGRCRSAGSSRHVMPHFITRQIFTGAGKVGSRGERRLHRGGAVPAHPAGRLLRGGGRARDHAEAADRQHPRRAARRRAEVPPAPRDRRRRQPGRDRHVPEGRHHRARAVDDRGRLPARDFAFAAPVQAMRQVSYDLSLRRPLELVDGTTVTALEMQWELFDRARKYARGRTASTCVGEDVGRRGAAPLGARCSPALETDPIALADQLDWVAKYRLIDGYRERHGLDVGRRPAGGDGPAVPRPPAREVAVRPAGRGAAHRPTPRSSAP